MPVSFNTVSGTEKALHDSAYLCHKLKLKQIIQPNGWDHFLKRFQKMFNRLQTQQMNAKGEQA
jgi:hypothetical protein